MEEVEILIIFLNIMKLEALFNFSLWPKQLLLNKIIHVLACNLEMKLNTPNQKREEEE